MLAKGHFTNEHLEDNYLELSMRLLNLARQLALSVKTQWPAAHGSFGSPQGASQAECLSVTQIKAGTHGDWTTAVSAPTCLTEKTKNKHLEFCFRDKYELGKCWV